MGRKAPVYNKPWRYALAMLGLSIMGYMYTTYGTFFYNDKLGLPLATIGMANVLFSLWDAFNDPIAGVLSDRTRTRFGRRRPWLMVAIPLFILAAVLFFSPAASLGNGLALAVYFTFFLMLTETANTIASVNYHSLLPELFREDAVRNRANATRQALQLVGMIIGVSLVPMLASALGYQWTAVLLGVLGGALTMYSILGCKERRDFSDKPQPKLLQALKAVSKNRNFWLVAFGNFFYQATVGLLLAGIPFFIKYALGLPDTMATVLTACVFVTAIPTMYVWYKLINRMGTLRVWRIALLWTAASVFLFFFVQDIVLACVFGVFLGAGIAGITANIDLVGSIVIEDDAARSGLRREATIFAGISFITRLSGLVRSGVFALMFLVFGFESGENPGLHPGEASRFMMSLVPALLLVCAFVTAMFVRFRTGETPQKEEV